MTSMISPKPASPSVLDGIIEREEHGVTVLSPERGRPVRRIIHVNSYGGKHLWEKVKCRLIPAHQLLGCIELVRKGYEVALVEPLTHFNPYRRPFPHDLTLLRKIRRWLGPDDIIYAGHTLLYWLPVLKSIGIVRPRIVSLTYAKERLDWPTAHSGVITLTPAAATLAKAVNPGAKVLHIGWGVDLPFFPHLPYRPEWLLSCGIANRDFRTLAAAAAICHVPVRVICPGLPPGVDWPPSATVIDGGSGWLTDRTKSVSVRDLLTDHYPRSAGSVVIMKHDPEESTANGFTNMIEAMALGQPLIVTRTGALPGELDVEAAGCGLHVPADDPQALAVAMKWLIDNPEKARAMGEAGRRLCEKHYNMDRFAGDLDRFFQSL
jgi:glycosyltransferase involved in cell wall biosynthesis